MYQHKENFADKVKRFFDGKGFYIALSLCAVAIVTVTYITIQDSISVRDPLPDEFNQIDDGDSTDQSAGTNLTNVPKDDSDGKEPDDSQTPTTPEDKDPDTSDPDDSNPPEPSDDGDTTNGAGDGDTSAPTSNPIVPEKKDPIYVLPSAGTMMQGFSATEPSYSTTMQDWRLHQGIDFKGDEGSKVKAFSSGTVERTYFNDLMGYTVVIKHSDSLYSIYQNLQESLPVKAGDAVEAGDVIGGIGRTASSEYLDDPHLHFEVIADGARVDPANYLPSL